MNLTKQQNNELASIKEPLDEKQKAVFDTAFYFKFLRKGRSFSDSIHSAKSAIFDVHPNAEESNRDREKAFKVDWSKTDIKGYSDQELSLLVFKTEWLYKVALNNDTDKFLTIINNLYTYREEQLVDLLETRAEELNELIIEDIYSNSGKDKL